MAVGVPISSLTPKVPPLGADYFPIVDTGSSPISVKRVTFDSLKAFCLADASLVKIAATEQAKTGFVKRTNANGTHEIVADASMPFNRLTKISLSGTVTGTSPFITPTTTEVTIPTSSLTILGKPVTGTAPTANTFLKYDGTNWTPAAITVGELSANAFIPTSTDITSSNVQFMLPIGGSKIVVWAAITTTAAANQTLTFNGTGTPVFNRIYYAQVCLDSTGASVTNDVKMSGSYAQLSLTANSGTKIRVFIIGEKV